MPKQKAYNLDKTFKWPLRWGVVVILVGILFPLAIWKGIGSGQRHNEQPSPSTPTVNSFRSLLTMPVEDLGKLDMEEVNLLCAEGLPGAEKINRQQVGKILDAWAAKVQQETQRYLHKFRQNPGEFNNSGAYFRILTLVTVLQQDIGVHYNEARILSPDFSDSRDLFVHGLVGGGRGGTCISMPVLYVAVGRRLGYPLKLVTAKAHLFARWENPDSSERFNIEATNKGLNCFPDEYYHTWPVALTAAEITGGVFLKSLTPAEELAVFLSVRGHCLDAARRWPEAQQAFVHAHLLAPRAPQYLAFLADVVRKEMPEWERVRVDLGQSERMRRQ